MNSNQDSDGHIRLFKLLSFSCPNSRTFYDSQKYFYTNKIFVCRRPGVFPVYVLPLERYHAVPVVQQLRRLSQVTTCLISLICKLGQNIQYYEQSWHEVGLKSPSLADVLPGCRCPRAGTGAAGRATATRTGGTSSSGSACTRGGPRHVTRVTIVW